MHLRILLEVDLVFGKQLRPAWSVPPSPRSQECCRCSPISSARGEPPGRLLPGARWVRARQSVHRPVVGEATSGSGQPNRSPQYPYAVEPSFAIPVHLTDRGRASRVEMPLRAGALPHPLSEIPASHRPLAHLPQRHGQGSAGRDRGGQGPLEGFPGTDGCPQASAPAGSGPRRALRGGSCPCLPKLISSPAG